MSATRRDYGPADHGTHGATDSQPLGAFEERLLTELRSVVAEHAALQDDAHPAPNEAGVCVRPASNRVGVTRDGLRLPRLRGRTACGALSLSLAAGLAVFAITARTPAAPSGISLAAFLNAAAASARGQHNSQPGPGQLSYNLAYETGLIVVAKDGRQSAPGLCMITWYDSAGSPVFDGPVSITKTAQMTTKQCESATPTLPSPGQYDPGAPRHWYPAPGSLPTGPGALLAQLEAEASHGAAYWSLQPPAGSSLTREQIVFELVERLLQGPISGALRAALYEAVVHIPRVALVPHAVDALGRPGVGVSMQVPGENGSVLMTYEFILNAHTYSFLGTIRDTGYIPLKTAVVASGLAQASGSLPRYPLELCRTTP